MNSQEKRNKEVVLGNYRILSRIGSGGMSAVYKAVDLTWGKLVALKVLSPKLAQHEAYVHRFFEESVAIARVKHPNVVAIHSIGEQEKQHHFFVMEYVEGGSLAKLVNSGQPIPARLALNYVLQAARGLQAAYRRGVVHRDVKPSNLLLTKDGTIKVADFGLARWAPDDTLGDHRKTIGTPAYMSPEQANLEPTDHRSDIYSLGATFFHLVTGQQPFRARTKKEVIEKHATEQVPSPRKFNPSLPEALCNVILKMMAKWPVNRYQTYEELIADLERLQREFVREGAAHLSLTSAPWGARLVAFGIDNALTLIPATVVALLEEGGQFFSAYRGVQASCAFSLVTLTVYWTFMLTRYGQSLGLKIMRLKICDRRGRPPGWTVVLVRSLALNAFYLFLIFPGDPIAWAALVLWLAGLASALFRLDHLPAHDVLCGVLVTSDTEAKFQAETRKITAPSG